MKISPTGNNILNPVERSAFYHVGGRAMKGMKLNKAVHRELRAKPGSITGGFKLKHK